MPPTAINDRRRTDTRARIQMVALEVFNERGWEGATLKEIADRLGITRPALYYHYPSKEAILLSFQAELVAEIDEIIAWVSGEPSTFATRAALLERMVALVSGTRRAFMRFAQRDAGASQFLAGAEGLADRLDLIASSLAPEDSVAGRVKSRLALEALCVADSHADAIGASEEERRTVGLEIAKQLVA